MFEQFRVLGHPVRAGIELFRALYTIIDAVAVCFIAGIIFRRPHAFELEI